MMDWMDLCDAILMRGNTAMYNYFTVIYFLWCRKQGILVDGTFSDGTFSDRGNVDSGNSHTSHTLKSLLQI